MRGGIENLSPRSFNLSFPPPFPLFSSPFCLLLSLSLSLSLSVHMHLCSQSPSLHFVAFTPPSLFSLLSLHFSNPQSRRQVVVNHTIISSSQMHFAPLLHSDKLNILSKTPFSRSGDISCSAPTDPQT